MAELKVRALTEKKGLHLSTPKANLGAQAFYKTQQFAIQSPEEAPKYPDEFSAKNDEVWWGLWDTGKACVDCANFWKLYLHRLSEKEASTLVR
jgi:hypothetical protein